MQVLKGKYLSSTQGKLDAVWIITTEKAAGIADFCGSHYSFGNKNDFEEEKIEDKSVIFPRVNDYFGKELSELTIKFKD